MAQGVRYLLSYTVVERTSHTAKLSVDRVYLTMYVLNMYVCSVLELHCEKISRVGRRVHSLHQVAENAEVGAPTCTRTFFPLSCYSFFHHIYHDHGFDPPPRYVFFSFSSLVRPSPLSVSVRYHTAAPLL